ncbi:Translin [Fomitopsis serialis]|uniref:Translin n=1 Tax=Fomitopsis serialis TaxID=139415 RepID=UPI002008BEFF|nr:Translin [Neoantrodia serialis]KAH9937453.1 Translin [Neoantrodia serialis]
MGAKAIKDPLLSSHVRSTELERHILAVFEHFRDELDDFHDRRERLIKSSRDVTNLSKKVIFLIHRTLTEGFGQSDEREVSLRAASRAKDKLKEVQNLFAGMREEVAEDRFWRHQRNVSPGLQEYIEALSFAHYLECGTLISYEEVQRSLSDADGRPYFPLPIDDYLLGLSDLTGELMRYAISSISRRGGRFKANEVCKFVRGCRADFDSFTPFCRELRKKQQVTSQSLEKIEDVAYAIAVRSSEYDLPPELLDDIVERTVAEAGFGGDDRDRRRRGGRRGEDDGEDGDYD